MQRVLSSFVVCVFGISQPNSKTSLLKADERMEDGLLGGAVMRLVQQADRYVEEVQQRGNRSNLLIKDDEAASRNTAVPERKQYEFDVQNAAGTKESTLQVSDVRSNSRSAVDSRSSLSIGAKQPSKDKNATDKNATEKGKGKGKGKEKSKGAGLSGTLVAKNPIDTAVQLGLTLALFAYGKFVQLKWINATEEDDTERTLSDLEHVDGQDDIKFTKKEWVYLFFWSYLGGNSIEGKWTWVGKVALVTGTVYSFVKSYLMVTLTDRLPAPCKLWVSMYWVPPHLPHKDLDAWNWLVWGQSLWSVLRNILVMWELKLIVLVPATIGPHVEEVRKLQVGKQPGFLSSRKYFDLCFVACHYIQDFWAFLSIFATLGFCTPTYLKSMISTGNPLYLINLFLNAGTYFFIAIWSGYMVSFTLIATSLTGAHADLLGMEFTVLPDFRTVNPHEHCLNMAKKVRDFHQDWFRTRLIVWETILAMTAMYFTLQLTSECWNAFNLSPLLDGEGIKDTEEWHLFCYSVKRMFFFVFCGMVFLILLPVYVNKRCDRLCQRVNDMLLHLMCGSEPRQALQEDQEHDGQTEAIQDRSERRAGASQAPAGASGALEEGRERNTDHPERPEQDGGHEENVEDDPTIIDDREEATYAMLHLQQFTDHVNFKSGLGVCVFGIRITPDLAKGIISLGLVVVGKVAEYFVDILETEKG